ncbi:mechanosensitive ion channel family protein [Reyranella sp.]|uniref:mechanosensitive ion channel family protein n=1 Tax=Reyranella sp. TaxID=1929291 RepID=UPI003BA908A6
MNLSDIIGIIEARTEFLPNWATALLILAGATLIALLVHGMVLRLVRRLVPEKRLFLQSLLSSTHGITRLALVLLVVAAVMPATPLDPETRTGVWHAVVIAFIVLLGWTATSSINLASDFYLTRSQIAGSADLTARKHLTQVRVLRRTAATCVIIITVAAALMTFESVKTYGVSLIASAGAAGLVVGLAARPLLTNLFAGIQIAITQPIRIGDAVIVENEWGWIEEITGTYVVIKVWDWRRLVVPLSYFLEKPFQNWTRQSTDLIGSVLLWVDYTVPVSLIRTKLEEIVQGAKLWDGQVVNLQVVDSNDRALQLRALVSARTPEQTWDLRCEVREKLIAFLQSDYPTALPKQRAELIDLEKRMAPAA